MLAYCRLPPNLPPTGGKRARACSECLALHILDGNQCSCICNILTPKTKQPTCIEGLGICWGICWEFVSLLDLTPETYQTALKYYFCVPTHTAFFRPFIFKIFLPTNCLRENVFPHMVDVNSLSCLFLWPDSLNNTSWRTFARILQVTTQSSSHRW